MFKLKNILKWSALSLAFSLLIIFSARAQTTTTDPQATCTGGGGKWCLSSGGSTSGWCSYSTSPCPAYDSASCAAQSGEWCVYTGGTGGYCNSVPGSCPINDQATCESKSRKWCVSTTGGTGWCASTGSTCPAHDSASCAAQSGEWCVYTGGTGGYCNSVPGSCPINDQATCTSKSRTWCNSTTGGTGYCATTGSTCSGAYTPYTPPTTSTTDPQTSCTGGGGKWCQSSGGSTSGYCSYSTSPCPAHDSASCAAQSGEWCVYTGGTGGYCNSVPGSCPINDQATCTSKSRTWCSSTTGGTGWCASTGSTCSGTTYTTSTYTHPTSTYTYPPTTYSWPNTESDCVKYKGVWCKSSTAYSTAYTYTGSCNMAGQICPVAVPAGMMSCWDGSIVFNYSSCPATPSTKTDCEAKGANWCASTATGGSTYLSTGWCTGKQNSCPKYPPAGQMSCPDNVTFATTLTNCPTVSSVITPPPPTYKLCPDGKSVLSDAVCPKPVVYVSCPDGTKVLEGTTCPIKTEDQMSVCLNKSGKWCLDKAGGTGYCVIKGNCGVLLDDNGGKKTEQSLVLDAKQIKLAEAKKKEYLRSLDTLEKTIKRFDDKALLAKIAVLKQKLAEMPLDINVFDSLEAVKDDILALRDAKNDLIENQGDINLSERDRAMQDKALKQLKQGMVQLARQLARIELKANRLEKQGFTVPAALKELITQGKDLANNIKNAKDFEKARDMGEALAGLSEELNRWMPRLEQLVRVSQVSKVIQNELTRREAEYKRVQVLVKRLKVDLEAYLGEIRTMLDSAKEANGQLKTKEWGEDEPFDFVQESIIDKLANADDSMANVRALANLKASVNNTLVQIRKYDARIARLVRQKKDVAELRGLVDQLKETYNELKALTGTKLANLDLANVVEKLGAADNLIEQLDDLLKISAPSALEKSLRGGLKVEKIEILEIERQVIRAYRVATFFRRAPQQMAEYFSSIKEAGVNSINRWRNRLAID